MKSDKADSFGALQHYSSQQPVGSGEVNSDLYKEALALERNREWYYRHTGQGRFESMFAHYDEPTLTTDQKDKHDQMLSDGMAGVERILDELDQTTPTNLYQKRLDAARKRVERHMPEALAVFNLIVQNGTNREESIGWLKQEIIRKQRAKKIQNKIRQRTKKLRSKAKQGTNITDSEKN